MKSVGTLARRAQAGDEEAFSTLARRYARASYVTALSILGEPADADDAVQDALVRAWSRLDQCRDTDRFGGWLITVVRRTALNHLRKLRAGPELLTGHDEGATSRDEAARELLLSEERRRLLRALETLSPGQREVILLHDVQGMRHGEVSEALGISEVMSRRHLSDARRRMREQLTKEEEYRS